MTETGSRWTRGALRHRNFRLLVGCDVTSMLGTVMATVAIPFAVLRSGGSATDVGYVTAAGLVPTVVFLLFGGAIADRLPRQHVIVATNVVEALVQAAFAVLVLSGSARVWEMAALTAARGCAFGFYFPAAQGLLPQTVEPGDLASANAVRRLGLNTAQIGGGALGGLVVALAGPGWGLVADAASYAVAALMRLGMRLDHLAPAESAGIVHELREGWRAFASRRWLWTIVVQFGLVNAVFTGAFMVLGPVVADRRLGGAGSWGLILTGDSVGAVLGALLMLRWRPRRLLLAASLGVPLFALPLLGLAAGLGTAPLAALAMLDGIGAEIFEVNWSVALQEQIPAALLSRVSAYDGLGSVALSPVGTALAGPVALLVGTAATLTGAGLVIIASAIAVLAVADVRGLTRRPADRRAATPGTALDPPRSSA